MNRDNKLISRYLYKTPYVDDAQRFMERVANKTVIPYQVEIQPGPTGDKICWLECPFCYGGSATNTGKRLSKERYIELIKEIAEGGVKKVIFAGWATDPLFYQYIDDLVETALVAGLVIGFNTRAINVSDRLTHLLGSSSLAQESYMSISVDAGDNESYALVHAAPRDGRLYDRVYQNIKRIKENRESNGGKLFLSSTYLINQINCDPVLASQFISDFKALGIDLIRFSFPQIPRGNTESDRSLIPSASERQSLKNILAPVIKQEAAHEGHSKVLLLSEEDHFYNKRTTPCFSRFIFPTIGFDGGLYQCSQSAGPNFHESALGDLETQSFWDLYYRYDISDLDGYFDQLTKCFDKVDCRCDRKAHVVNNTINQELTLKL